MEITFTRGGEHSYSTVARRDDGVTLLVPSFDRTHSMPHDLAHFVVERELGLKRGFWGCVAAGATFPGIEVVSGRRPPHAAERSKAIIREAGQHGTEAEVLVGLVIDLVQKGLASDGPAARALVSRVWRPSKPSRGPLAPEEVQRVCHALREAQQRWQALPIGQSFKVSWPVEKQPRR